MTVDMDALKKTAKDEIEAEQVKNAGKSKEDQKTELKAKLLKGK